MGDQASRAVEDEGIAGAPDLDAGDHLPDELEVDLGDRHADRRAVAGDGDHHERLRAVVEVHRPEPRAVGSRALHRRPQREIGAAVDPVQPDARHEQPFAALGVDQGQVLDSRDLAQQAERVEPVPLAAPLRPRQLHGPAELLADAVDEILDLHRREPGFGVQDVVQPRPLVAVAQPGLAGARDQQRHHDRGEQRGEVLPEQRPAARAGAPRHSMGLIR
jgi:hypothetical protein